MLVRYKHLAGAFKVVAGMFVGITLYANFGPEPEPEYRDVIVTKEVLVASEPDTVVRWRERVVYRTIEREVRAVAPGGAAETVASFCEAAATPKADTIHVAVPALVRSGTYDGKRLKLWEVQADGDLAVETFKARAPFQFIMRPDGSAFVQQSRWWWTDDAIKGGAVLGAGILLGKVVF